MWIRCRTKGNFSAPMTVFKPETDKNRSELMRKAQKGDSQTYNRLLKEIVPLLRVYFLKRLHDEHFVEDLIQQVLLRIHLYRSSFSGTDSFDPWMYTIARNSLWDHLKAQRQSIEKESLLAKEVYSDMHADQEINLAVNEALTSLTVESRRAVMLTKHDGFDIEEAAQIENISATALKVRVHRAMKTLRDRLWME